jgi:hypothetical protein
LIWDASKAAPEFTKENVSKRRNTMSEETRKAEKIEKAEQSEQEVKPADLPEQELDKVAGGAAFNTTKSNVKTSS